MACVLPCCFPAKLVSGKDFSLGLLLHVCSSFNKRLSSTVTRRCLPALEKIKGGVVVVGNETTFVDGNNRVNASDLLEASKSVLVTETQSLKTQASTWDYCRIFQKLHINTKITLFIIMELTSSVCPRHS